MVSRVSGHSPNAIGWSAWQRRGCQTLCPINAAPHWDQSGVCGVAKGGQTAENARLWQFGYNAMMWRIALV